MERILVTGGAGFIGSHTVEALIEKGYRVRVMDDLCSPVHRREEWPDHLHPRAERCYGHVQSRSDWYRALQRIDAVVHLAAYQDYRTDFSTFFAVNSAGTAMLYEVIVQERLPVKKILVASSQAVYGEGPYTCPRHGRILAPPRLLGQLQQGRWLCDCLVCSSPLKPERAAEGDAHPHTAYGISKLSQEQIALALGEQYDLRTVALRYSIVQGSRQSLSNAYSGALRIFTQQLATGQAPTVYEDGYQGRDFVSVHDVVRANLQVLEDHRADGQALNVGGDRLVSVRELAGMVGRAFGRELDLETPGEFRLGDTRHLRSDVSRMLALGWRPQVSMAEIVAEYVDWATAQPELRNQTEEARAEMQRQGALRRSMG